MSTSLQQVLAERQQLPIASQAVEVVTTIQRHQVVIVRGSTGCGKTTQVPQFILDNMIAAGNGAHCNIVVTQVRCVCVVCVCGWCVVWGERERVVKALLF